MQNSIVWLLVGAVFMAMEAFGISGVGFFFAGLAALAVGLLVQGDVIGQGAYAAQFAAFFGLTGLWAALLWKPMKRAFAGKNSNYKHVVGDSGVVAAGGLARGSVGQVEWSGTLMRAQLAEEEPAAFLDAGTQVTVCRLEGNTLFVKRKG